MTVDIKTNLGKLLLVLGLLLVANSAYIAAFGDPTLFYVVNGLLHPALGLLVAALFVAFLAQHRGDFAGFAGKGSVALLVLATVFGIYLAIVGMTRPHRLVLYAHVGAAITGLLALMVHLRPRPRVPDSELRTPNSRTGWRWSAGVMLAAAAFYAAVILYHRVRPNPRYLIRNPQTAPLSMDDEGGGA